MTEDQIVAIRDAQPVRRLSAKQKRRLAAIESIAEYMHTYSREAACLDYTDKTFIDDVLYGLGVALDPEKHKWASGYDVFKDVLRAHLTKCPTP